ncbi:hypothetical protein C5E44_03545 [Nocardia nova]|uniref:AAA family ATPase n=1 Tax=Nocardia nova TaxID=37330 RepID=UPI000CE9F771|nr:hypothetical protein C5E44_03545 [Nocardia nova]
MSVRFRLDKVILTTTEGAVEYTFTNDLTVLSGPTGVGKTTLLELIKYGFGAKGTLAEVVLNSVESVTLEIRIRENQWRLTRSVDAVKGRKVRVTDLITQDRLPDQHVDYKKHPSLNSLLMTSLGLPDDVLASSLRSSRKGSAITFADILTYIYIPQGQINHDIAHSKETYRDPKRKAVFELLFGITDVEIFELRSQFSELGGEITTADMRLEAVLTFLTDSGTTTRADAQRALMQAQATQQQAESRLARLRNEIDPISDRETRTLRDLLTEAERGLADAHAAVEDLNRRRSQCLSERRRVSNDLDRLGRMREAGQQLATIEFNLCPRCMQSLSSRTAPSGVCRLCLQPELATENHHSHDDYEFRQLTDQLAEMDQQLDLLARHQQMVIEAARERQHLVVHLSDVVERRTSQRVSPRLQAFSDASEQAAAAASERQHWESIIRQWDAFNGLQSNAHRLRAERENLRSRIDIAERALAERRTEILDEISEEFDSAIRAFGVPDVVSASIDQRSYLPIINNTPFAKRANLAGGITTATQVAYWCTLITVAMRHTDTGYPAFLLIDSPRLALNTAATLSEAMYRRLSTQVAAVPGRLQVIVADNELPASYRRQYAQIEFKYSTPTIRTIEHPGEARVKTLAEDSSPSR